MKFHYLGKTTFNNRNTVCGRPVHEESWPNDLRNRGCVEASTVVEEVEKVTCESCSTILEHDGIPTPTMTESPDLWKFWNETSPKVGEWSRHGDVNFLCTCWAFPEQYDAYRHKRQIGYVRLRHGRLTADYLNVKERKEIFHHKFDDEYSRFLDEETRECYMTKIGEILIVEDRKNS